MKTFIPNDSELATLKSAAEMITRGNRMLADGKKLSDAGKLGLADWLRTQRQFDIDAAPIGTVANVHGVAIVEVASMQKFAEKEFALAYPAMHASFIKPLAVRKFKPFTA